MYLKLLRRTFYSYRKFSTKSKISAELEMNVCKALQEENYKPKRHPGVFKKPVSQLPDEITNAIQKISIEESSLQNKKYTNSFKNMLHGRFPPQEENEIRIKYCNIIADIQAKMNIDEATPISLDEQKKIETVIKSKADRIIKSRLYHWKPIDYTNLKTVLLYLISRGPADFAVLRSIFNEIKIRDKDFSPKTLFDFGSGVGTVTWAVHNIWGNVIRENINVDTSSLMNDINRKLQELIGYNVDRLFLRQFLSASSDKKFDLVVSSYSLFELPSTKSRLETIANLWNKTEKYLVLIELGTNAGFKLISEARDFILYSEKNKKHNTENVQVFAPCPHDLTCPRVDAQDGTPCNFELKYFILNKKEIIASDRYCYVVLKKGKRKFFEECWPRIVRPVLNRSRHSICRLCTNTGKLEEIVFTANKHGKLMYRCAKSSRWGDILPINIKYSAISENKLTLKDTGAENNSTEENLIIEK